MARRREGLKLTGRTSHVIWMDQKCSKCEAQQEAQKWRLIRIKEVSIEGKPCHKENINERTI